MSWIPRLFADRQTSLASSVQSFDDERLYNNAEGVAKYKDHRATRQVVAIGV